MTWSREFVLPWPPATLSPNARQHWSRSMKAKKSYRKACWIAAVSAAFEDRISLHPPAGPLTLQLQFRPPTKAEFDKDNLVARMKAGIDGIADALQIDDKRFGFPQCEIGAIVKDGCVIATVSLQAAARLT